MAGTDTDGSVHEHMTRVRLKMLEQKLANERERGHKSPSTASNNELENQLKIQNALQRRNDLLEKIRNEHNLSENEYKRPRTYSARRRYTPSPLPPPSRRSMPDLNRLHNRDNYYRDNNRDNFRDSLPQLKVSVPDMSRHIIEHQFRAASPRQHYLPPIQQQYMPPPQPQIQPIIQQPVAAYAPAPQATSGFGKADFMEMMMMQNAQMHQMVVQQMMMNHSGIAGGGGGGGGSYSRGPVMMGDSGPPVHHHHYSSQPAIQAAPQPVLHHYSTLPPLDIRRGSPYGYDGHRAYSSHKYYNHGIPDGRDNHYYYH